MHWLGTLIHPKGKWERRLRNWVFAALLGVILPAGVVSYFTCYPIWLAANMVLFWEAAGFCFVSEIAILWAALTGRFYLFDKEYYRQKERELKAEKS